MDLIKSYMFLMNLYNFKAYKSNGVKVKHVKLMILYTTSISVHDSTYSSVVKEYLGI